MPILGICYGLQVRVQVLHAPLFFFLTRTVQEIAWNLGGTVAKCEHREYGFARVQINKFGSGQSFADALFEGLGDEMEVRQPF